MRLDAYYYGFDATGEEMVDRVLSAVACAGKAFHYTSEWTEPYFEPPPGTTSQHPTTTASGHRYAPYEPFLRGETCAEQIQNAANDAAAALRAERARADRLAKLLGEARDSIYALSGMASRPQLAAIDAALSSPGLAEKEVGK